MERLEEIKQQIQTLLQQLETVNPIAAQDWKNEINRQMRPRRQLWAKEEIATGLLKQVTEFAEIEINRKTHLFTPEFMTAARKAAK